MQKQSFLEQIRRNAVALISLAIAISSLGYNSWRNEHSEYNRNQRWASFEMILKLGELQELTFLNHYDCNTTLRGNTRTGWVIVLTIDDLAMILGDPAPESTKNIKTVWDDNFKQLEYDDRASCLNRSDERRTRGRKANDEILKAINAVRADVRDILHSLD